MDTQSMQMEELEMNQKMGREGAQFSAGTKLGPTQELEQEPTQASKAGPAVEGGEKKTTFRHEGEEITINIGSMKEKAMQFQKAVRQRVEKIITPFIKKIIENKKLVMAAAVIFLAGIAVTFYGVSHIGYRRTLNEIVHNVNIREGDLNVIINAVLPDELAGCFNESIEILSDVDIVESTIKYVEKNIDNQYARMDDYFGSNTKISLKVLEKEKMSRSQLRRAESSYQDFYENYLDSFVSAVDEFDHDKIINLAEKHDLLTSDVVTLRDNIDAIADYLEEMDITAGYNLVLEIQIKGSRDSYTEKINLSVIKSNGKWMINFMSVNNIKRTLQELGSDLGNILWFL